MATTEKNEGLERGKNRDIVSYDRPPYWQGLHRQWWFWVGLILMLIAITIYVLSDDLAFLPRR
jgi:hypothetical protein